MTEHAKFRVSCKAILYNADHTRVIVVQYLGGESFGLPGGHLEADETPEHAIQRELLEELGVQGISLRPVGFLQHRDSKIVLLFVGELASGIEVSPDMNELCAAHWASLDEIRSGAVDLIDYQQVVLEYA